ncbi:MAG: hypothetical protein IJ443_04430 [Firmicutes bacterium]|nr:hypothetical protein [Bacillota bacterium]
MENYIDGSKDRAIRLNEVDSSASISINNNIIEDCGDENGELIKAGSTNGASIDIENNYWDNETELGKVIVGLDKPSSTGITGGTFPALDDISKYLAADTNIVAKVGETYCSTLKEAVAVGGTITVLDNIELTETLVIPVNTTVTLDLNGKTVSGITDNTGATAVIENKGTLTIQDSSEEGTGKITSAVSNPDTTMDPYPSFANNTVNNRGDLVVESGTIENTTVGGACYAIDNYSGGSVTVNGGTVEGKANFAIRMFVNSTDANNAVTVNGGIVKGTRAIWIHLAGSDSSVTPKAEVNVTGGTLESNESEYNLAIYSYSYGNSFAETNVKITGGTFNGDVAFGGGYKGDTETVTISGGTFTGSYGVYSYGDMAPFITGGVYSADVTKYVVKDINTYVMNDNYYVGEASKPAAPSGKVWADDDKDGVYELKTVSTPSTGGGYVSIEKPSITVDDGATADLSIPGTTLKITVKDGYELVDVTLNGISKGAVSELKGLKTGDKVVIITKAIDETTVTDPEVELIARSEMSKAKGKKAIKVYWFAEDGSELTYDGYEIFRSVKRYSGYGKKPIFETEREAYWNTDIEEGTKYFYKVRGYNFSDGEKEYSDWSKKAWRTVE